MWKEDYRDKSCIQGNFSLGSSFNSWKKLLIDKKPAASSICLCSGARNWNQNPPRTSLMVPCGQESACQCNGHQFNPQSRKIPNAAQQLSPCATTAEPACLESVLHKRSHCNEMPTYCNKEQLLLTIRESLHAAMKTQCKQN